MKQKMLLVILAMVLLLPAAACGGASSPAPAATPSRPQAAGPSKQAWEERWEKTISEAKKEKGALVYMAPSAEAQRAMTATFKQKFGLELEFVVGRGAVIAEKIFAERRAGLYLGDAVVQGNTVQLLIFKPQGVLEQIEPLLILPEIKEPNAWLGGKLPFLDKDRTIIYFFAAMRNYIARNSQAVADGEVKTLQDLLQPKWKGQIIMFDPTIAGSGSGWFALVYGLLGREKGADYMRRFVQQGPVITRDDRVLVEGLARGKYKLGVGYLEGVYREFKAAGAPIEVLRTVEGNFLAPSMGDISILKNSPHPNTAIVFLNWLLTKEGQTLMARTAGTPSARVDVPTEGLNPANVLPPGEKFYFETEEDVLAKDELMVRAREIFGSLLK